MPFSSACQPGIKPVSHGTLHEARGREPRPGSGGQLNEVLREGGREELEGSGEILNEVGVRECPSTGPLTCPHRQSHLLASALSPARPKVLPYLGEISSACQPGVEPVSRGALHEAGSREPCPGCSGQLDEVLREGGCEELEGGGEVLKELTAAAAGMAPLPSPTAYSIAWRGEEGRESGKRGRRDEWFQVELGERDFGFFQHPVDRGCCWDGAFSQPHRVQHCLQEGEREEREGSERGKREREGEREEREGSERGKRERKGEREEREGSERGKRERERERGKRGREGREGGKREREERKGGREGREGGKREREERGKRGREVREGREKGRERGKRGREAREGREKGREGEREERGEREGESVVV
ncbi:unnamed protein product [Closterium sp. NIES-65]|nr:unnamed protein product [Closterium sp. NIES-65]